MGIDEHQSEKRTQKYVCTEIQQELYTVQLILYVGVMLIEGCSVASMESLLSLSVSLSVSLSLSLSLSHTHTLALFLKTLQFSSPSVLYSHICIVDRAFLTQHCIIIMITLWQFKDETINMYLIKFLHSSHDKESPFLLRKAEVVSHVHPQGS